MEIDQNYPVNDQKASVSELVRKRIANPYREGSSPFSRTINDDWGDWMADKNDSLGDRMKMYEATTTGRVIFKGQPIVARLDGKSFHTFTKGLQRPYDERLKNLMVAITKRISWSIWS